MSHTMMRIVMCTLLLQNVVAMQLLMNVLALTGGAKEENGVVQVDVPIDVPVEFSQVPLGPQDLSQVLSQDISQDPFSNDADPLGLIPAAVQPVEEEPVDEDGQNDYGQNYDENDDGQNDYGQNNVGQNEDGLNEDGQNEDGQNDEPRRGLANDGQANDWNFKRYTEDNSPDVVLQSSETLVAHADTKIEFTTQEELAQVYVDYENYITKLLNGKEVVTDIESLEEAIDDLEKTHRDEMNDLKIAMSQQQTELKIVEGVAGSTCGLGAVGGIIAWCRQSGDDSSSSSSDDDLEGQRNIQRQLRRAGERNMQARVVRIRADRRAQEEERDRIQAIAEQYYEGRGNGRLLSVDSQLRLQRRLEEGEERRRARSYSRSHRLSQSQRLSETLLSSSREGEVGEEESVMSLR